MEIFADNKDFYTECITQLLDHYYNKIFNEFCQINVLLRNEPINYQKALDKLKELKERIIIIQRFYFNLPEREKNSGLFSVKDSINELYLKIAVKQVILENKINQINTDDKNEKNKLENLINLYKQNKSNDIKDLIELESILNKSDNKPSEEDKKAINFIENFVRMENDDIKKFLFIFEKFHLCDYTDCELINQILNLEKRVSLLNELITKYQKYYDEVKGDKTKDAIDKILKYFNFLKEKCNVNKPLFES